MNETRDEVSALFRAKLLQATEELAGAKIDALAMVEALGDAFLSLAASCAPSRREYERVTDQIAKVRDEVWQAAHPH